MLQKDMGKRKKKRGDNVKEREYYLDVARVVSMICVIVIHIACINWYDSPIKPYPWLIYNLYDCICRFCVPVFLMISGYLFLNPEKNFSIKKMYTKNIKRLLTAFFFWSFFYAAITSGFATQRVFTKEIVNKFIHDLFFGHYHMWFMYVLLGMYLLTPVMRAIAKDRKVLKYFLILSFCISYLLPTLQMAKGIYLSKQFTDRIDWSMAIGYSFFYLMGYYLGTEKMDEKRIKRMYGIGIFGFLFTFIGTSVMCMVEQYGDIRLHEYLTLGVSLYSCGAFIFFKEKFKNINPDSRWMRMIKWLSEMSFGIYLANDFGIIVFRKIGLVPDSFFAVLSVPVLALMDLMITIAIVYVISRIPILKKHVM